MTALAPSWTCDALRALAGALHRAADFLERRAGRCLPLEPLRLALHADEAIAVRRHQIFTRYY